VARPGKLQFRKPPILRKLASAVAVAAVTGFPPGAQLSASAPAAKFQIQCDIAPNIAIRQVAPAPRARQQSDSAPASRFLSTHQSQSQPLTLVTFPRPFIPVDTAQWQGKYQVYSDIMTWGFDVNLSPSPPTTGSEFLIRIRRRGRR